MRPSLLMVGVLFFAVLSLTLPVSADDCLEPLESLQIPDMSVHVDHPVDFKPALHRPCGSIFWEKLSGPPGFEIDGAGGRFYWVPAHVGEHAITVQASLLDEGHVVSTTESTFYVSVDDFTMTYPQSRDYLTQTTSVPIMGRAHGPDFVSYSLDYVDESAPQRRHRIAGPVLEPVETTGRLGVWDVSRLPAGGRYVLNLRVQLRNGETTVISSRVILEPSLKAGWPQRVGPISHSVVLADLDGDGPQEVLAVTHYGELYAWRIDGTQMWKTRRFGAAYGSPSVGDIDGDDRVDIVWATARALFAHDIDGRMLAGFPQPAPSGSEFRSTPSLADLDGDGRLDIVIGARARSTNGKGRVLAYGIEDGVPELLHGWPQEVDHFSLYATPSVGDLDGDGVPEVVAESYDRAYAWYANGIPVDGLHGARLAAPITGAVVNSGGSPHSSSQPAIADLDLDGIPEIIIGSNVLRTDGTPLPGWEGGQRGAINTLSPAVGELDGNIDNGLEVVLGSFAWHADGSPVAERSRLENLGSAVLADCGDGDLDTMFGSRYPGRAVLVSVHPDGHPVEGYPKSMFGVTGDAGAPVVGDFDGDGRVDVAVAIDDGIYRGVVAIYEMPGPNHDENHHWPMLGHDVRHSGFYSPPDRQP
ncbi:MAG: VCBS repeat-containing protein [Acidobacteriota bacterium]|nr:VCBS repeat-containing protein [Acidobacteriota bacterium]